jgi:hypothetical protein
MRPMTAPASKAASVSSQDQQPPADKKQSFADSVTLASRYTSAGAGVMTGFVLGTKAAIESAYLLGISDATALFLAGVAIGGAAGGYAGYHGAGLAGRAGAAVADRLGLSEGLGQGLGATGVSALAGAALTGSPTGALLGAGAAIGGGGFVHLATR